MSKATWLQEYYPITAQDCPKEQAIEHSLQKWKGLRLKNLHHHRVSVHYLPISISATSCALCEHYHNDDDKCLPPCGTCPIVEVTGFACDRDDDDEEPGPWCAWASGGANDPEPMISMLERVLEAKS